MAGRELHEWKPGWVIAPGVILREWLDEHHLSPEVAAVTCAPAGETRDYCLTRIKAVLAREPMTGRDDVIIAKATQTTPRLWLALEHDYRAGLEAGLTDASST